MGEFSGRNAKTPELIIDYLKSLESGKYLLKLCNIPIDILHVGDVKQSLFEGNLEWYISWILKKRNRQNFKRANDEDSKND